MSNNQFSDRDLEAQISHISDNSQDFDADRYGGGPGQKLNGSDRRLDENNELIYTITTSGTENEYINLDNKKFRKSDLLKAFGGSLNPGYAEKPPRVFANPVPLGLSGFSLTVFVLSLINCGAMGVHKPNIVVGLAIFYGGFIQVLAGMWAITICNTFAGTVLASYGGFWLSYGAIYIDFFGIIKAYDDPVELENAVGFYLLGWTIFTFFITLMTMKSTVTFFGTFLTLTMSFLLLTLGNLAKSKGCTRAGGVFGLICGFLSWYCAYSGVANKENSYILARTIALPEDIFHMSKKKR